MRRAAKLVIIDENNKYLLLKRSGHPSFPGDPDLPGGEVEKDEEPLQAAIRELEEETGIVINAQAINKQSESNAYEDNFIYYLYTARLDKRPVVTISWEHAAYEWLDYDLFLKKVKDAQDTYMHMVYDTLKLNGPNQ